MQTIRIALLGILGLLGVQGQALAANWKVHSADAALCAAEASGNATLQKVVDVADTAVDTAATASGTGVAYAVVGKSGPAILSTLKAAGGPATVGSAAGFAVAGLQGKYLYDNRDDQTACDVAAASGYVGAAAGSVGSIGLGMAYGVGASGLASIGGLVGGGMVVGTVSLIALPAAAAVPTSPPTGSWTNLAGLTGRPGSG